MCLTKSISNITEEAVSEDANSLETAYLNNLEEQDSTQFAWMCHIELNGKTTQLKIGTGAEVSAMNEQTFNSMTPSTTLNKPSEVLHGPSRQPLDTLGSVTISLAHKGKSTTQEAFVIPNLLAGPTSNHTLGTSDKSE